METPQKMVGRFNEMSVLFPLLSLYTVVYLALMGYDFTARERFEIPNGLMFVYMGLVVAYAADKEIRRWVRKESPSRNGVVFVYAWMVFYLVAFVIHSLKPEYVLPKDLTPVTLEVFAVFFGSKTSKKIFEKYGQEAPETSSANDEAAEEEKPVEQISSAHETAVLEHIRKNGRAQREDLMAVTKLSRSSLGRLMDQLEAKGLVEQVGDRKGAYYRIKE